ncbi:hypothetical protein BDZ89DRAFT_1107789 [Hymenopellis radicata]|nr:hypothetical protein BDZ89DRAFT_1107789 [Hymenopellis radicata]
MSLVHLYVALFLVTTCVYATSFDLADKFQGHDFLTWVFQTFDDPTHGRVNYVDKDTALQTNLSFVSDDKFIMRADAYQMVPPGARGRDSVRIASTTAYNEALFILDLQHMPEGCGTWPAFWTISRDGPWPHGGEIDIIEGVNTNSQNLASLHTSPGCTMNDARPQNGRPVSSNCDSAVNYNQGCGVAFKESNSYGSGFNANGGGWYAMSKTLASGVKVWFWPRDCSDVPDEVRDFGCDTIDIDKWGQPDASFPPETCDQPSHFNEHNIIFDLTICGDWAGSAFGQAGCGTSTCDDYADRNPDAFKNAFWEINSLRVYNLQNRPTPN